jgi:hypothetical protein
LTAVTIVAKKYRPSRISGLVLIELLISTALAMLIMTFIAQSMDATIKASKFILGGRTKAEEFASLVSEINAGALPEGVSAHGRWSVKIARETAWGGECSAVYVTEERDGDSIPVAEWKLWKIEGRK